MRSDFITGSDEYFSEDRPENFYKIWTLDTYEEKMRFLPERDSGASNQL